MVSKYNDLVIKMVTWHTNDLKKRWQTMILIVLVYCKVHRIMLSIIDDNVKDDHAIQ